MHTIKMIRHLAIFVSLSGIFPFSMQVAQAEPALTSIEVTPSNPSIDVAQTLQFSATGTFDDGSSRLLGGDVWTLRNSLPVAQNYSSLAVVEGNLYVMGGYDERPSLMSTIPTVNRYNPSTDTFTPLSPLLTSRTCQGTGVINGIIYAVAGATRDIGMPSVLLNTVEAYDPGMDAWTTKASMSSLSGCVKVSVVNGILYAVKPNDFFDEPLLVEAYDPATNMWSTKTPLILPTIRFAYPKSFTTAALDGTLYVIEGNEGEGAAGLYAYDPITDTWSTKAPMLIGQSFPAAGVVDGLIYVAGGADSDAFQAYNPKTNTWIAMGPMPRQETVYLAQDDANGLLYGLTSVEKSGRFTNIRDIWSYQPPEVKWSSSNASIATINGNGFLTTSIIPGASTITATAGAVSENSTLTTLPQPLRGVRVRVQGPGIVGTTDWPLDLNTGILCPGDCTEKYVVGTTIVLYATPDRYHVFNNEWGGACAGQGNPCTLQMDDYHMVTAIFRREPPY